MQESVSGFFKASFADAGKGGAKGVIKTNKKGRHIACLAFPRYLYLQWALCALSQPSL